MDLQPAKRVRPDPEHGWRGADLTDDEYVDDGFIAEHARRAYAPLQPHEDKLFPIAHILPVPKEG